MTIQAVNDDGIARGIRQLIEKRVAEIGDQIAKEFVAKFDERVRKEIGTAAIQVLSEYDLYRDGRDLIIRVRDTK